MLHPNFKQSFCSFRSLSLFPPLSHPPPPPLLLLLLFFSSSLFSFCKNTFFFLTLVSSSSIHHHRPREPTLNWVEEMEAATLRGGGIGHFLA